MKKVALMLFAFLWEAGSFAQNINKIEYFIDNDPGHGLGTNVTIATGTPVTIDFSIPLANAGISDGFHFLSVRAKDANNGWSITAIRPFYKEAFSSASIPNIAALEYFIDTDPGFGAGTSVPLTAGSSITQSFTVLLPSVADGFHFLTIRAKDENNHWSIVGVRPFLKETLPSGSVPNITALEYFIDNDPGFGAGTALSTTAGSPVMIDFTATLSSLSLGTHKISIRAKDADNKWSIVGIKEFAVSTTFTLVGNTPTNWCRTTAFNLPFTAVGSYSPGNIFTAQLSNSSGNFNNPTTLGTLTSTTSGTILATIPNSIPLGSGYRIRVVSSNPSIVDNPSIPITVAAVCPPPCPTSLTLVSTADDYSGGLLIKEANAATGTILATNKISGTANVTYQAKSINLNAGFRAENGTVFKAQVGGCN